MTDLSLVLTVHSETTVAGPTMRSADAAVRAAREGGLSVEMILALDAPTDATAAYFSQPRFDGWVRHTMSERDLGRVRNAILPATSGRYIAFLDADDLFSENWLLDGVRRLQQADEAGQRVIAHPELNILFDATDNIVRNVESSSRLFTPYFAYVRNYYDALCLAPRTAHEEIPYPSIDMADGLGYEDWHFALEALAEGWEHVVVPDTIIFKRRRDESIVTQSKGRNLLLRKLPGMAIDRVRTLATPRRTPDYR